MAWFHGAFKITTMVSTALLVVDWVMPRKMAKTKFNCNYHHLARASARSSIFWLRPTLRLVAERA